MDMKPFKLDIDELIPDFAENLPPSAPLVVPKRRIHAARRLADASEAVNVENIKHIAEDKSLIGDVLEKTTEDWNAQEEMFYQQTGFRQRPAQESQQQEMNGTLEQLKGNETSEEQEDDNDFGKELEEALQFEDDDE
ncbi:hypothetical protein RJ639_027189 [Escallonia herrerae]|uniref:Uncharacterized protein n=1 Tax=Escallonia herrerae TaxID=1293975 RepID=A0AA88X5X4_9ASTE|nr:hypothetical protein RJ639_027189 [Escallonia herrerae]